MTLLLRNAINKLEEGTKKKNKNIIVTLWIIANVILLNHVTMDTHCPFSHMQIAGEHQGNDYQHDSIYKAWHCAKCATCVDNNNNEWNYFYANETNKAEEGTSNKSKNSMVAAWIIAYEMLLKNVTIATFYS